jgi:Domain of unknown function (DUF1772)
MIEYLSIATQIALGLFAGSLLTEAVVLVPHWRSLSPQEFFRLHAGFGYRLFHYFAPLTVATLVLAVLNSLQGFFDPQGHQWQRWLATLLCLLACSTYPLFFKSMNAAFATGRISHERLPLALAQWASVHYIRTLLVIAGSFCSLLR